MAVKPTQVMAVKPTQGMLDRGEEVEAVACPSRWRSAHCRCSVSRRGTGEGRFKVLERLWIRVSSCHRDQFTNAVDHALRARGD